VKSAVSQILISKLAKSGSLASQIVNRCLSVTDKDNVTILVYPHTIRLGEEIAIECFKNGADALLNLYTDEYQRSYFSYLSEESLREPSVFCRALAENSTVEIFAAGAYDPAIYRNIPSEKTAANGEGEDKAHNPISKDRKIRMLGINTSLVTRPRAKAYGFNFANWNKMMQAASKVDYSKLALMGNQLKSKLSDAKILKISHPNGTELTLETSGRKWIVSDGVVDQQDIQDENYAAEIPAGDLSVVPVETSASGKITFNTKLPFMGKKIGKVSLEFDGGRLKSFTGDSSSKGIREIYDKSAGDKNLVARLQIGFNPKAEIGYIADSIVSGAVTLSIGGNIGIPEGKNKSAFFYGQALVGGTLEADGRPVVKSGKLL
jgi:aminopeptidase